jgi:hypothetical protein
MTAQALIVFEHTGDWAVAWRRTLAAADLPAVEVVETRSTDECLELLESQGDALLVAEALPITAHSVLELLATVDRRFPRATTIVMAEPLLRRTTEQTFREHGAQLVISSRYELPSAMRLTKKHFSRNSMPSPGEPLPRDRATSQPE